MFLYNSAKKIVSVMLDLIIHHSLTCVCLHLTSVRKSLQLNVFSFPFLQWITSNLLLLITISSFSSPNNIKGGERVKEFVQPKMSPNNREIIIPKERKRGWENKREASEQLASQLAAIFKVRLGLREIKGRDRET